MRVLVDECAPKALKSFLSKKGHTCRTVQEAGWSGIQNGELLALAENEFDVLLTIDTNIPYQQTLRDRKIAIVVLRSASNRLEVLRNYFPACAQALEEIQPGQLLEVGEEISRS